MIELFTNPAFAPFGVAFGFVLFLAAIEIVGALVGFPASAAIDSVLPDIEIDADIDVDADLDASVEGADAVGANV
ncbi:MAG: hypothetical protein AAGJ87_12760, partial [Pseudomonadota bacterium]